MPNGKVKEVWLNPAIEGAKRPLFSMATANPEDAFHVGQIADVTEDGHTFAFEDWRVDAGTDRDYNDVIFHIKGAKGSAVSIDQVIDPAKDWRSSEVGQQLLAAVDVPDEPVGEGEIPDDLESGDGAGTVDEPIDAIEPVHIGEDTTDAIDPIESEAPQPQPVQVEQPGQETTGGATGDPIVAVEPVPAAVDAVTPDRATTNQPLIGIIDTGFSESHPDIDPSRLMLGRDWVDGDGNPLLAPGEGNPHGTHILGLIAATQDNGIGIDGINDQAPVWLGRAIGSGQWHQSLTEFVDAAKASSQPNAVVNLSFDLTQINSDGSVIPRYDLTSQEIAALRYAQQNGVLIIVAAGNENGLSTLSRISPLFDNILTVGAAEGGDRASYDDRTFDGSYCESCRTRWIQKD